MSKASESRRPVVAGLIADMRALGHAPRELWLIYAVKLVESIAYFAVVNVLILYLHDDLRLSDRWSGTVYGTWGTLISLVTFLSGFVADVMGLRKALLLGAATLVVGRAMLMASEVPFIPLAGLVVSVWGVASMKPVMTAAIKTVVPTELRAFAYNIFYVVMNMGAFVAGQAVSFLRRAFIGHAIRPGEWLDGVGPAAASARDATIERLLGQVPTADGQAPLAALEKIGSLATGGRAPAHWTEGDLGRVEAAVAALRSGAEVARRPSA